MIPLLGRQAGWTYAPPDEHLCVTMVGNYQPEAAGMDGNSSASSQAAAVVGGTQLTETLVPKQKGWWGGSSTHASANSSAPA